MIKYLSTTALLLFLISCDNDVSIAKETDNAESIIDTELMESESTTSNIDKPYVGYYNSANEGVYQMDDSKEYDGSRAYLGLVVEYSNETYSVYGYEADEYMNGTGKFSKEEYENAELGEDGILYFESNVKVPTHIKSSGVLTNKYSLEKAQNIFIRTNISDDRKSTMDYYKAEILPKFIQSKTGTISKSEIVEQSNNVTCSEASARFNNSSKSEIIAMLGEANEEYRNDYWFFLIYLNKVTDKFDNNRTKHLCFKIPTSLNKNTQTTVVQCIEKGGTFHIGTSYVRLP